ncbi:hypothetical protein TNCV_1137101 [Trichonephila clavipes]|nr:hypothetical protein TNCV_1137101 [Trichonephila clavipes]
MEQSTLLNVDLWSGREKKKREIGMARKRAENRERSLGFPGPLHGPSISADFLGVFSSCRTNGKNVAENGVPTFDFVYELKNTSDLLFKFLREARGHREKGQWVFGGRGERGSGKLFLVADHDPTREMLLALAKEWIRPGTTKYSDCRN